jgi:hypothetical protein
MVKWAVCIFSTNRIYLRLPRIITVLSVSIAETPRISRVCDGPVWEALAVRVLGLVVRRRMRMWTAIVGHVEALREASRMSMWCLLALGALR